VDRVRAERADPLLVNIEIVQDQVAEVRNVQKVLRREKHPAPLQRQSIDAEELHPDQPAISAVAGRGLLSDVAIPGAAEHGQVPHEHERRVKHPVTAVR
jgi:hypothetical protein